MAARVAHNPNVVSTPKIRQTMRVGYLTQRVREEAWSRKLGVKRPGLPQLASPESKAGRRLVSGWLGASATAPRPYDQKDR